MRKGLFFFFLLYQFIASTQTIDTLRLVDNDIILINGDVIIADKDTIILIPHGTRYQFVNNRYLLNKGFYDSVYSKAQKNRITKELYNLLIVQRPPTDPQKTKKPVKSESFFEAFEGKTIRKIEFIPVDILGGNVNDTTIKARSRIGKLSNSFHNDTRKRVINNHLLFSIGDNVDPYELADSERIIRSLAYIEDVRIKLVLNAEDIETVNALVIYKDRFPWNANFSLNSQRALNLGFTNRNILGTGHEFGVGYLYNGKETPNHGYDLHYTIRGIQNTFIDGTVYASDNYLGKSTGISFNRDFVSPEIKYYGEVTLERVQAIDDLVFADSLFEEDFHSDRLTYDLWAGRSFEVGERSSINLATRLQHDNYFERPEVQMDSNEFYHDHHLLLGALSYNKITFLKSRNILSFNITEDIPEGYLISFLYGRDWNEFDPRTYRGIRANYSNYTKVGYITMNFEAGYFKNQGIVRNDILEFSTRYFSPLIGIKNTTARIFTRLYYFNGDNLSIPQSQTLAGLNRIQNIRGEQIRGEQVFTISNEFVVFQPWYFYGFRFATYAHAGIGLVKETRSIFNYNQKYPNFGGGLRIRNESLAFNTFEFRFSVYPNPPEEGAIFTFNITINTPSFFGSPNIRKPRVVGLN